MKKSIIPVAAFIAGMAIVPSVFAAEYAPTQWADLKTCLTSTVSGTVCSLGGDFTVSENSAVAISGDVTLDLNGHNLYYTGSNNKGLEVTGKLTVRNGQIANSYASSTGGMIYVEGNAELNVEADATIAGVNPVVVRTGTPTVNIAGTLKNDVDGGADDAALWIHGDAAGSTVNILGTAVLESTVGAGIVQTGTANTTAAPGAKISGLTGILIKGGSLALNGATVTGTNSTWNTEVAGDNSGYDVLTGAAIQIEGRNNNETTIDIEDSLIESKSGSPFISYAGANGTSAAVKNLTINNSSLKGADEEPLMAKSSNSGTKDIKWTDWSLDGEKVSLKGIEGSYTSEGYQAPAEDAGDNGEEGENPNTADTIATYLTIATVALLGLGATAFVAKKSNR